MRKVSQTRKKGKEGRKERRGRAHLVGEELCSFVELDLFVLLE